MIKLPAPAAAVAAGAVCEVLCASAALQSQPLMVLRFLDDDSAKECIDHIRSELVPLDTTSVLLQRDQE